MRVLGGLFYIGATICLLLYVNRRLSPLASMPKSTDSLMPSMNTDWRHWWLMCEKCAVFDDVISNLTIEPKSYVCPRCRATLELSNPVGVRRNLLSSGLDAPGHSENQG